MVRDDGAESLEQSEYVIQLLLYPFYAFISLLMFKCHTLRLGTCRITVRIICVEYSSSRDATVILSGCLLTEVLWEYFQLLLVTQTIARSADSF